MRNMYDTLLEDIYEEFQNASDELEMEEIENDAILFNRMVKSGLIDLEALLS